MVSKTIQAKQNLEEVKQAEIAEKTAEMVEMAKKNLNKVLNAYRIEKTDNDAFVYERIILNENYAGMKGVKEFVMPNGKITYYTEKLVKKYSQNKN